MSDDVPPRLFVELTARCNLHCSHCYRDEGIAQPQLPYEPLRRLLTELHRQGLRFVSLTGGEPTLHPRCGDLVSDLLDQGVKVALSTNGMSSLTRSVLKQLGRRLASVQLSVDGVGEAHDAIRGRGTFARLEDTLALLGQQAIHFDLQVTVGRRNIESLPALLDSARGYAGLRRIQLTPLLPLGRARPQDCLNLAQLRGLHRLRALAGISPFAIDTDVVDQPELRRVHQICVTGGAAGLLWWLRSDGGIGPWPSAPHAFDVGSLDRPPRPWLGSAVAHRAWAVVENALGKALRENVSGKVIDSARLVIEAMQASVAKQEGMRWN